MLLKLRALEIQDNRLVEKIKSDLLHTLRGKGINISKIDVYLNSNSISVSLLMMQKQ